MHEIAEFLHKVPPFDTLAEDELAAVVSAAEIEFHAANTTIHHQGAGPPDHVWVVRRGAVELIDEGRVLDLLGEGEMFGHASVLAGRPTGFQMRAHEDTLCYRIPERAIAPVLAQPAGLRYVARSLGGRFELIAREAQRGPLGGVDPANRRVADMIHGGVVMCPPGTRVQEAARRMVEAGSSAILVDLGSGGVGIVTDRDLRTRVVAAGLGPDAVVEDVMTAPARMVTADMTGSEVLLQMLDRGVRHFPVVDARRRVIGVVSDTDLMAVEARAPFLLRTDIGKAATPAAVATAARGLNETLLALEAASVAPATISRVIATVHDAIVRRLLELVEGEIGAPPSPYTWFALGSYARREAFPSSDQDNALAWAGPDDAETEAWMKELAERVVAATANAGITACRHGAVASKALFRRPIARWEDAARSWLDDPDQEKALILVSVVVDGRPVWAGDVAGDRLALAFAAARDRQEMLRRLAIFALAHRPPTGFFRNFVLEAGGERKGTLDIKHGGLLPIVDLARSVAMAAGVTGATTASRLEAAAAAGTLSESNSRTLADAFELCTELRMAHQLDQIRRGVPPDDYLAPASLSRIARSSLKDAFRAVAAVQREIATEMGLRPR